MIHLQPSCRALSPFRKCHVVVGCLLLLAAEMVQPAAAQQTDAIFATSASPTAQREAEYASLASDVNALDRELSLVKRVVKLVTPTVVHIEATPLPRFRGMLNVQEAGSGVIAMLGSQPYVLTNRHVIRHSSDELIDVHLADGRVVHPQRSWSDDETDVAVIELATPDLVPARLGDSDALEIGDYVLAVGSPFGLSHSVTRGIVSAKGRHNLDLGDGELKLQDFIQTDAAINPGNSGGPLVNLRGEVIGLNTAIASSSGGNEGIGFSIPINVVSRVARALIESNEVPRGYLGVFLDRRFDEKQALELGLPQLTGTRVSAVPPNTPAEKADLRTNDVILEFNGVRIESDSHLITMVKLTEVGKEVELLIFRDGHTLKKTVKIADTNDFAQDQ
jgi:S1-C subfamily serine protease